MVNFKFNIRTLSSNKILSKRQTPKRDEDIVELCWLEREKAARRCLLISFSVPSLLQNCEEKRLLSQVNYLRAFVFLVCLLSWIALPGMPSLAWRCQRVRLLCTDKEIPNLPIRSLIFSL